MVLKIDQFTARLEAAIKRGESGQSNIQKGPDGKVIPSPTNIKPNIFDQIKSPKSPASEGDA